MLHFKKLDQSLLCQCELRNDIGKGAFFFHLIVTNVVIKLYWNLFDHVVLFLVLGIRRIVRSFFRSYTVRQNITFSFLLRELVVNTFILESKQVEQKSVLAWGNTLRCKFGPLAAKNRWTDWERGCIKWSGGWQLIFDFFFTAVGFQY